MRVAIAILVAGCGQIALAEPPAADKIADAVAKAQAAFYAPGFESAHIVGQFKSSSTLGEKSEGRFIAIYDKPLVRIDFDFSTYVRLESIEDGKPELSPDSFGLRSVLGDESRRQAGFETVSYDNDSPQGVITLSPNLKAACAFAGSPFTDPLRLHSVFAGPMKTILKLHPEKYWAASGDTFVAKIGAGQQSMEYVVDPAAGFHVTGCKFGDGNASFEATAIWKQDPAGYWYVRRTETTTKDTIPLNRTTQSECTILSFTRDVAINPTLFDEDSTATPLDLAPPTAAPPKQRP